EVTTDYATWLTNMIRNQWDVSNYEGNASYPNPSGAAQYYTGPFCGAGGNSWVHYTNPVTQEYQNQALAATDMKTACSYWANVQEQLLKDYTYRPIATPVYSWYG